MKKISMTFLGITLTLLTVTGFANHSLWLKKIQLFDHNKISFLVIQQSARATFIPGTNNCYQLNLSGLNGQVLYFSDQPNRLVGHDSYPEFLNLWNKSNVQPNAGISGYQGAKESQTLVFTLKQPNYDAQKQNFSYQACLIEGQTPASLVPKYLNNVTVFIDPFMPSNL